MMDLRTMVLTVVVITLCACNGRPADDGEKRVDAVNVEAAADPSTQCPSQSFEEFLKHFAGSDQVRNTYTAPSVAVADYKEPDSLENPVVVIEQVPRAEYEGFTLKYDGNSYHNVDAAGSMDPAPVNVSIERRGADYYVRYAYGMSEGNSWLFKPSNACWILTEDPEPPSV